MSEKNDLAHVGEHAASTQPDTASSVLPTLNDRSERVTHTPGPYEVKGDRARVQMNEKFGCGLDPATLTQCELRTEADVEYGPYLGVIYDEANARLIAAAPDLLDLVRRFALGDRTPPATWTLRKEARALIAKLEGKG